MRTVDYRRRGGRHTHLNDETMEHDLRVITPFREGINTKLLQQVAEHILEEPRRLAMDVWRQQSMSAPCGVVGCIAGWAVTLADLPKAIAYENSGDSMPRYAGELLGLSSHEKQLLFYVHHWPDSFQDRYREATWLGHQSDVARITVERMAHFVRTGE